MIVDYAERWPQADLIDFLSDCRQQAVQPIRVLLVARSAGGWWSTPTRHLTDWGHAFDDVPLLPLDHDEGVDRSALYAQACRYFASIIGVTVPDGSRDLSGDGFSTVLSLHMAALVDVEAKRRGEVLTGRQGEISSYLMKRERDYWESLLKSHQVSIGPDVFAQTVYTAILTGALPRIDALAALARTGIDSNEPTAKVLKDHAVAYPVQQFGTALEPLHPDLLGEDFLALLLPAEPVMSSLADPWSVDAPRRLVTGRTASGDRPAGAPWVKPSLITLIETARRWEHVTRQQLVPLLADRPEVFSRAGSAAISRLADNQWIPESVLDAFEARLPFRNVELDAGAAVLSGRLETYRLERAGDDSSARAEVYRNLAHRLYAVGDHAGAAVRMQRSLKIRVQLAGDGDDELAELAFDLDAAGIMFHMNGNREYALTASRGAVNIFTDLVGRLKSKDLKLAHEYRSRLTYALANFSARSLPAEVRRDTAREGVRQSRLAIGDGDPTQDHIELSGCLQNLGNALSELDQWEEALTCLQEAVAIRRVQAVRNFGFYAPLLNTALSALWTHQAKKGPLVQVISTAEEKVRLLRELAQFNEALFGGQREGAERKLRDLKRAEAQEASEKR
ncbi:tetratricopeptide repeat protein [Streptomyces sp. NPDC060198]|uniref:tetratricopeptide repeat protein n=1 Tax=Streptomyces sp. NPDC060198 TaxID=3347070 RepID=UPI0036665CC2